MKTIKNKIQAIVNKFGYQIVRKPPSLHWTKSIHNGYSNKLEDLKINKAHYGCGTILFGDGWVNIDHIPAAKDPTKLYVCADLAYQHPFPSNFFKYSFCEDFIEHLDQAESLRFFCEAFRTLQPNGVLRMSTPGLRGVLKHHYRSSDYEGARIGEDEVYIQWGHKHFYYEDSLSIVARHIGFSNIIFVEYGKSKYEELCNLEYREHQKGVNLYAELTK